MRDKTPKLASVHSLGVRIALALVLLVVSIGLVNYAYHSRVGLRNVVADARSELSDALALMQASLQQALREGNMSQAQSELATFSADPDVVAAVVVDGKRQIIASSRRAWLGEPFDTIAAKAPGVAEHWDSLLSDVVKDRRGEIRVSDQQEFLAAAYPLRLPQRKATRRHVDYGFLGVIYDMRPRKAYAETMVASQTGFFTGVLVAVAVLLWATARLLITARVQRLVHAAGQLAAGNLRTRVRLSGSDELAALGRAFDRMAQKIAHNQNKLFEHERQLRSLLESTAEGIIGIDGRGQCTFCNAAAASYLGADNPVALLHKDVASLFGAPPRQTHSDFRGALFQALENGEKLYVPKIPLNRRDGQRAMASLRIHPMEQDGTYAGAVASFMDVTEQQETRRKLAKASVVFEHSAEAIVVTDRSGTIEQANNAYAKLTGVSAQSAQGKPLAQLLKWESPDNTVWHVAETTGTWQGELWQTRADGSEFPSWTTVSAVRNSDGDLVNFIIMFTDITEKKNWEAHIEHLAYYDALTNLPNRRLFGDRLKHAVERAKRRQSKVAVLFADLDRFKNINDSLGHTIGDRLLQEVARRLSEHVREQDTVARLGGDEFTILLDDLRSEDDPVIVAEKILGAMNEPFYLDEHELFIGASIGIGIFPDDASLAEDITKKADAAMYLAKQQGRNRLHRFEAPGHDNHERRRVLESELRDALLHDQLTLHFQPQVNLDNNQIIAVEALARWNHPERGQIPPAEFLPVAEASDLALEIGEWLVDAVCRYIVRWRGQGVSALPIALNLSPRQVKSEAFLFTIRSKLQEYDIDPHTLQLEISEDALISAANGGNGPLRMLRDAGVRVVVDDYGIGSTDLEQIRDLPIDRVKINRGFAQSLPHDRHTASIMSGVVALAHALQLDVIAKGVERASQATYLKQCRCDAAQGYLYYRPMPGEQLERLLRDRAAEQPGTLLRQ